MKGSLNKEDLDIAQRHAQLYVCKHIHRYMIYDINIIFIFIMCIFGAGLCLFSWLFTTVEGRIQGVVQNLRRNPQDRSLRHQSRGLRAGRVFSTARRHSPQQRPEKRRRIGRRRKRSDRGINRVKKRLRGCKRECSQIDRFLTHRHTTAENGDVAVS